MITYLQYVIKWTMSILFPSCMQFLSRAAVLTVSYITNADLQARLSTAVWWQ